MFGLQLPAKTARHNPHPNNRPINRRNWPHIGRSSKGNMLRQRVLCHDKGEDTNAETVARNNASGLAFENSKGLIKTPPPHATRYVRRGQPPRNMRQKRPTQRMQHIERYTHHTDHKMCVCVVFVFVCPRPWFRALAAEKAPKYHSHSQAFPEATGLNFRRGHKIATEGVKWGDRLRPNTGLIPPSEGAHQVYLQTSAALSSLRAWVHPSRSRCRPQRRAHRTACPCLLANKPAAARVAKKQTYGS